MVTLELLGSGFATALRPENLSFAFLGCLVGTFIGVIPGVGPVTAIAVLIPITYTLEPTPAIIMLAAIYYGSQYGGAISSIMINTPGEAASAVTCLEGHPMAKNGRAGPALAMSAIASFVGGTIATIGLVVVAVPLARLALKLGPPEIFALAVVAVSLVSGLAGKSVVRGGVSACLGVLIASVGIDPVRGAPRFTFGSVDLLDGFGIVPVVMGLFGIGEILVNAENPVRKVFDTRISSLIPTRKDLKDSIMPMLRGTGIGFGFGVLPGMGVAPPTFVSYIVEKRISKTPEKFGTGMIQGIAAPEAANNAAANAAMIPLLALGIPSSASVAVMMGAFMMNGIQTGPLLFQQHAEFVWALIASLYIGNIMLLILNMPLVPMWVAILKVPYSILFALILAFVMVGAFAENNSVFDIGVVIGFGVVGYVLRKLDIPLAPLVMMLILTPIMESTLRRSLELSGGDFSILVTRPISGSLLLLASMSIVYSAIRRTSVMKGDDD